MIACDISDLSRLRLTSSIIEELLHNMSLKKCTVRSGNCIPKDSLSRPGWEKEDVINARKGSAGERNIRSPQINNDAPFSFIHHRNALPWINHSPAPGCATSLSIRGFGGASHRCSLSRSKSSAAIWSSSEGARSF